MRISYSTIVTFLKCQQKYKWEYVDCLKRKQWAPEALSTGRRFHLAMEVYGSTKSLLKAWRALKNAQKGVSTKNIALERAMFYHAVKELNLGRIIGTELSFNIPGKITGTIDAVSHGDDGKITLIDYKTTTRMSTSIHSYYLQSYQLLLYAQAFEIITGITPDKVKYILILKPSLKGRKKEDASTLTRRMVEWLENAAVSTLEVERDLAIERTASKKAYDEIAKLAQEMVRCKESDNWQRNFGACIDPIFGECPYFALCYANDIEFTKGYMYESTVDK